MSESSKFNLNTDPDSLPKIVTTHPEHILRHSISDEELDTLCDTKTDLVLEILLIAIGGVLGTLPTSIVSIIAYFKASEEEPHNLALIDFIQIIIFFSCVVVTFAIALVFRKKRGKSSPLREQIRGRTNKAAG
ncbi:hypothetical protein [Roseibium sp.]|uniref:hypothetical protein n=1 Tax=Roseibium sp. TaxID=1936156 RepID=UPI0039EE8CA5